MEFFGGGLSTLSLAYFLQEHPRVTSIDILEKESAPGGLARSYAFAGLHYNVGPHIMFSKNKEVLDLMVGLLGDNVHKLRRSNKIYHDGRFVKYPFENELSALAHPRAGLVPRVVSRQPIRAVRPQDDAGVLFGHIRRGHHEHLSAPYNEKIWKFDPAFMDTQMVDRIPKPPPEDIVKSTRARPAKATCTSFTSTIRSAAVCRLCSTRSSAACGRKWPSASVRASIASYKTAQMARGHCRRQSREYDRLISTIPIPELICRLQPSVPQPVANASQDLKFNSIAICMVHARRDHLGDNFAVMVPDRDIIFHRLSKLDFLLPSEDVTRRFDSNHGGGDIPRG